MDRNGVEWIILFVVSWIIFLLLVDWKQLKINVWCGILAMGFQLFTDTMAMRHGLYEVRHPVFSILGSSAFFGAGPVFVIGTLLAQYQPRKRWMAILHVAVLTTLYSLQEYLLVRRGLVVYTNWNFPESMYLNLDVISTLAWFSIFVLDRMRLYGSQPEEK